MVSLREHCSYYFILLQDPYEMTDLATNRDYRSTLKMMKGKLTYLLKLYPIQPLATNIPKKKKSTANGVLAACWCRPPNKFPCRCPLTN